jgi:maltose/moltooligosaccharide transporter
MQTQLSAVKPRLSFWQLWNMSFGFFGIQIGFALQNANASRIFSTLGADTNELALFWLAAPVTGLLVQPIIGYLSDNTWHAKWGRRRPFFFIGALAASLALAFMPNSTQLWMAVAMLWILDAGINVSMEPFRAFVADKLNPSQQTSGFAMQTFFIGIGGLLGSLLPQFFTDYMGVSNAPVGGMVPDTVRYAFYVGGAIYFLSVLWTVLTATEAPPEDLEQFRKERREQRGIGRAVKEIMGGFVNMPKTMVQLAFVQFFTWIGLFAMWIYSGKAVADNVFGTVDAQSLAFQDAANWVGVLFGLYGAVSAFAAFLLPVFARATSRKFVHTACLVIGGLSLVSIFFIKTKMLLLFPFLGIGVAWASILSMPYAILAGSLPAKRMGYFMGLFNFFVVIPQIVSGLLLGWITTHLLGGHTVQTLVVGGVSMIIAGLLCLFVTDQAEGVQ